MNTVALVASTPAPVAPTRAKLTDREFDFKSHVANLTLVPSAHTLRLALADFPQETLARCALLGLTDILAAAYRSKIAKSPADAFAACAAKLDELASGKFPDDEVDTTPRSALEAAIRARAEINGKGVEATTRVVLAQSTEWQSAFVSQVKADPATASAYAKLWSPKRAASVDFAASGV